MRILIATRSVSHSDLAVRSGNFIHRITGGTITLLTVVANENMREMGEAGLLQALNIIEAEPSQIQTRIRTGHAVEEITLEAAAGKYDLIIIGEPARNRFIRRWQTPIAEHLIARAPCPVLIIRGEPRPFRRLLVCESGHEPTLIDDLTARMTALIKQADKLTVLHVMSQIAAGPGVAGWQLRADAEALIEEHTPEGVLLDEDVSRVKELNITPEAKVRHGLVVREILAEAKSGDYDLVVIGAHPGRGWEHLLLGDLAREIVGLLDRPLLVIKR